MINGIHLRFLIERCEQSKLLSIDELSDFYKKHIMHNHTIQIINMYCTSKDNLKYNYVMYRKNAIQSINMQSKV